jgi:hypothetical protein
MGFLLGGFVPIATFVVAHREVTAWYDVGVFLVIGGLLYSARTVFEWGKVAFRSPVKSAGFVLLLEGVMVTAHTPWLGYGALLYLVLINGIATGCNLSLDRAEARRR